MLPLERSARQQMADVQAQGELRRQAMEMLARLDASEHLPFDQGGPHPFHDWATRNGVVEDLAGAEFIVLLDRYENDTKWGVHAVDRREEPHRCGPFRHRTIGLFRKAEPDETVETSPVTVDSLRQYLTDVHCRPEPVSLLGCDDPELFEYIGRQVIPIEWKSAWAEKDPHTIGLVQVMR